MDLNLVQAALQVVSHQVPDVLRKLADEPVNQDLIDKNKYANNSEFVPESVYKRVLNKMTNKQWSFIPYSIKEKGDDKGKFVEYIGLLIAPGYGIHTGIGTQSLNKKDNQNAVAAAKTYAFKNACKEMGLAPNVGDENFDEMLFEHEVEEYVESKKKEVDKKKKKKKPEEAKKKDKAPEGKKKSPLKEQIKELRDAYDLDSDDDLVAFLQIWDEDIMDPSDMDDDDWTSFFKYFEKNKPEFEEF